MNAFIGFIALLTVVLMGFVIYEAFNEGMGTEHVLGTGTVISKKEDSYFIGNVYHTDYKVTVEVDGQQVEAKVDENEYHMAEEGTLVKVGYTKGRFSNTFYYNSVVRTVKYPEVD